MQLLDPGWTGASILGKHGWGKDTSLLFLCVGLKDDIELLLKYLIEIHLVQWEKGAFYNIFEEC